MGDWAIGRLGLGDPVELTIAQAGPFTAEVAWRQRARAGLEFIRPLPKPILARLGLGYDEETIQAEVEARAARAVRRPI
ncbi:MAG: hypothetical protein AAF650_08830 [Pseudomonadota bacterium]